MLDAPREPTPPPQLGQQRTQQRRNKRPAYFEKEQAFAEQQKAEAEARRLEFERRDKEKKQKIEERERFRKAMAKARTGGKNGQRKLGKESKVLLERVKRMVGQ
jgi:cell division protein FtsL